MAYSQVRKYQVPVSLETATVSMKIFEDPDHGLHHVIRSLPAGMDIAPDVWRFEKQGFAERQFLKVCADLERRGFVLIETARV